MSSLRVRSIKLYCLYIIPRYVFLYSADIFDHKTRLCTTHVSSPIGVRARLVNTQRQPRMGGYENI